MEVDLPLGGPQADQTQNVSYCPSIVSGNILPFHHDEEADHDVVAAVVVDAVADSSVVGN